MAETRVEFVSHEEMLEAVRRHLADEGVTARQVVDAVEPCGCHLSIGGESLRDLWFMADDLIRELAEATPRA